MFDIHVRSTYIPNTDIQFYVFLLCSLRQKATEWYRVVI